MEETENKETDIKETDMDSDVLPAEVPAVEEAPQDPGAAIGKLEEEKKQYFDQLLRLTAEFENYRKRVDREKPELIRHGKNDVMERMIPLYDVLLSAHEQVAQTANTDNELVRGLEMIFQEFTKLFKSEGVAPISSVGERFDFDRHEVLGQVETDEFEEGIIVEELQRGYLIGGKVVRPAKVRVAKKKA